MKMRTRIIATIGPATAGEEAMRSLMDLGVGIFRLNFSHGQAGDFREMVTRARRLGRETGRPLTLMQDLSGPKIRLGELPCQALEVSTGDRIWLGLPSRQYDAPGKRAGDDCRFLPLDQPDIVAGLADGDIISVSDGDLRFSVCERVDKGIVAMNALGHGLVTSRKGLTFPGKVLPVKAMTDKDRDDLRQGLELGLDAVAMSYVQSADDVRDLKDEIKALGTWVPVVAKLERQAALDDLEAIADLADVVMVARGDLGLECPLEDLPALQKRIISTCNRMGTPVIVATQMLLSMVNSPVPTRAETTDVANAVLDGADCLMLSEETAIGKHPLEAVDFMRRVASKAQLMARDMAMDQGRAATSLPRDREPVPAWMLAHGACRLAEATDSRALVAHTASGSTARLLSACRPLRPIHALTPDPKVLHHLNFSWGVKPVLVDETLDDHLARAENYVNDSKEFKAGDSVVITAGQPKPGQDRTQTNVVKIFVK